MKGGPTLHEEDARLFAKGILKKSRVYTLREGEVVRNIDDTLMILEQEMIKIKGQGVTWTCMFYDGDQQVCKIYENRPAECQALKCWDLRELQEVMARPRLKRMDLIEPGDGILKIIGAHEHKCSYGALGSAVKKLGGSDSEKEAEKVLDILKYDYELRPLLAERLNMDPMTMDFFFGRHLTTTIRMFGLCVRQEGDAFLLSPIEKTK